MADEQEPNYGASVKVWLGIATSIITILAWFGVQDWDHLRTRIAGGGRPTAPTPASSTAAVAPPPQTVSQAPLPSESIPQPSVTHGLPAGCDDATSALGAFNASQSGAPAVKTEAEAHAKAAAYRELGRQLSSAAALATVPDVRSALKDFAADYQTMAADYDALDADAFSAVGSKADADGQKLLAACRENAT